MRNYLNKKELFRVLVFISAAFVFSYCSSGSKPDNSCKKSFNSYFFVFDNDRYKQDNIFLVLTEMNFGKAYHDPSSIKIGFGVADGHKDCFSYQLYFEDSDSLKLVSKDENIVEFGSRNFNQNLCANKKLVLIIEDHCDRTKNTYVLDKKFGKQKGINLHSGG